MLQPPQLIPARIARRPEPTDSLGGLLSNDVLPLLGVERIDPRDVVLRPNLMPRAVDQ